MGNLLALVRRTPYRLCLLIDEYDNFANEVMMADEGAYRRLVSADGPFKHIMKWVKAATEGEGLERLFLTGVTPVALSDLTSGMNMVKNVSQARALNALCGFTEHEVAHLLGRLLDAQGRERVGPPFEESLDMLRTWYNGLPFFAHRRRKGLQPHPSPLLFRLPPTGGPFPASDARFQPRRRRSQAPLPCPRHGEWRIARGNAAKWHAD